MDSKTPISARFERLVVVYGRLGFAADLRLDQKARQCAVYLLPLEKVLAAQKERKSRVGGQPKNSIVLSNALREALQFRRSTQLVSFPKNLLPKRAKAAIYEDSQTTGAHFDLAKFDLRRCFAHDS